VKNKLLLSRVSVAVLVGLLSVNSSPINASVSGTVKVSPSQVPLLQPQQQRPRVQEIKVVEEPVVLPVQPVVDVVSVRKEQLVPAVVPVAVPVVNVEEKVQAQPAQVVVAPLKKPELPPLPKSVQVKKEEPVVPIVQITEKAPTPTNVETKLVPVREVVIEPTKEVVVEKKPQTEKSEKKVEAKQANPLAAMLGDIQMDELHAMIKKLIEGQYNDDLQKNGGKKKAIIGRFTGCFTPRS